MAAPSVAAPAAQSPLGPDAPAAPPPQPVALDDPHRFDEQRAVVMLNFAQNMAAVGPEAKAATVHALFVYLLEHPAFVANDKDFRVRAWQKVKQLWDEPVLAGSRLVLARFVLMVKNDLPSHPDWRA